LIDLIELLLLCMQGIVGPLNLGIDFLLRSKDFRQYVIAAIALGLKWMLIICDKATSLLLKNNGGMLELMLYQSSSS